MITHTHLKFSKISLNLCCKDMGRSKDVQATVYRTLQKIVSISHVLFRDMKVRHDSIDCNLERMESTPMIIKHCKGFAEILISFFEVSIHEVGLNQNTVKFYCLCMKRTHIDLTKCIETMMGFVDSLEPLLLIDCNFAQFQQSLDIIITIHSLTIYALHMTSFDCLFNSAL